MKNSIAIHIVYKTTNKLDGKFYVGVHKTYDLDNDCYYGSGKYFLSAVNKHGKWNFDREVLYIYHSRDVSYKREAYIVNREFLEREDTYNLRLGGFGGMDQCKTKESLDKAKLTRKLNGTDQCKHMNIPEIVNKSKLTRKLNGTDQCKHLNSSLDIRHRSIETRRINGTLTKGLRTRESIEKARITNKLRGNDQMKACHTKEARELKTKTTLERALMKYPEMNMECELINSSNEVILRGTLYELNVFLFSRILAMTEKKVTIPMFHSGRSFTRGKWKGHYIHKLV